MRALMAGLTPPPEEEISTSARYCEGGGGGGYTRRLDWVHGSGLGASRGAIG